MGKLAAVAFVVLLAACGSRDPAGAVASAPPATATPAPSPVASPSPSPTPAAAAQAPSTITVTFSGAPAGSYPVHLHSICDGRQAFHITVLQTLVIRGGAGTIRVPAGYAGRGLCVIVYSSPSLAHVLATRRI